MFDAGPLLMFKDDKALADVTVISRRKLVEKKAGMVVYLAENDLSAKGGTAADVLRKATIITVDAQGNVSMRGNSNLRILINGKYSGQMARSVADALNMMPADNIKAVEIISNPSARYDAEGAAGVINIITKKNNSAFSGTIEVSGSNWEQMINPRISFSRNRWILTMNGHLHRLRTKTHWQLQRISDSGGTDSLMLHQSNEKDNTAPHGSGDLTMLNGPYRPITCILCRN